MYTVHVKYPLFLSDFNETWDFLDRFSKNAQRSNFMKNRPVEAELFVAGTYRRTDITKLIVTCRNFANAPKKQVSRDIFELGDLCNVD